MFDDKFDPSSAEDILRYSGALIGKSLAEVVDLPASEKARDRKGKGRLGNLVEKYFFGYEPNNSPEPDFPEANLELKVTGLKSASPKPVKAKERLVLNMINYQEIVNETFETSSFFKKCQQILILCYLYDSDKLEVDQIFTENQFIFRLKSQDIELIKRDWQTIRDKVIAGKAHELSEGDTYYLKANRKGAGGDKDLTEQPFSTVKANRRSWSFNSGYLTSLIEQGDEQQSALGISKTETFEDATYRRISKYIGESSAELFREFGLVTPGAPLSKSVRYDLMVRILSNGGSSVKELQKAGIRIKTIRLNEKRMPREAMSFENFDYMKIVNESWSESVFSEALEERFLFAVFSQDANGDEILEKVSYWTMPFDDRLSAQKVWEETRERVIRGEYVFPQASETDVAHVRPKGKNSQDKILCPDGEYRKKLCFWLNKNYIKGVLESL